MKRISIVCLATAMAVVVAGGLGAAPARAIGPLP
jgi:hypothetical protein